jgi:hypothetical protein
LEKFKPLSEEKNCIATIDLIAFRWWNWCKGALKSLFQTLHLNPFTLDIPTFFQTIYLFNHRFVRSPWRIETFLYRGLFIYHLLSPITSLKLPPFKHSFSPHPKVAYLKFKKLQLFGTW